MKMKKVTLVGKIVIFSLVLVMVLGGTYFFGGFSSLKEMATSDNGSVHNSGSNSANEINISLDEWVGWKSVVDANGGLTTKKGSIYDELGIKVNISIINDATQSSNALINGKLDGAGYTINRYAFLYPKFKENNTEVVMPYITNFSSGGDGIIAKQEIKSVEDLLGKKIAVPRYSEAQTLVWWLLNKSGLNEAQVKQVEKDMVMFDTPDDAAKAFFAGQVDAAATWQPYLTQAQDTTGAKLLFSTKAAHNIILDGIVFEKGFLDKNKETVAKFIEGSLKAESLYTTDFTSIKNTMPLFSTESNDNIKAMSGDATLSTYSDNVELLESTAKTLFVDMSNIWTNIGEKSLPKEVNNAFESSTIKLLEGKFEDEASTGLAFTEEQRAQAKQVNNVEALLKKSVSINFQPNSAAFVDVEEASKVLNEFVGTAQILNGAIIQIEGNVADTGGGEAAIKLSEQRAKTVAVYLQNQDVDPTRFVIVGNGESKQIADNDTEEGKKQNRRTDVFFKIVE